MKSFKTKLFLVYSITLIMLTITISFPLYLYFNKQIKENIMTSVEQLAGNSASSVSAQLTMFKSITFQLYNSYDYTRSTLANYLLRKQTAPESTNALQVFKSIDNYMLMMMATYNSIERLNLYLNNGDRYSKHFEYETTHDEWTTIPFKEMADNEQGGIVLSSLDNGQFSLSRMLQWGNYKIGYLEAVLKPNTLIDSNLLENMEGSSISILNRNQLVFTSHSNQDEVSQMLSMVQLELEKQTGFAEVNKQGIISVRQMTDLEAFSVVTLAKKNSLFAPLIVFRNTMLLAVALIIIFSVAFYYLLAKLLTRPIASLKQAMNEIELDNESELKIENHYKLDEIESLRRSFQKMNTRIKESMDERVHFHTLQLQSHFQKLQAQINPHFLFNMLSVITITADRKQPEAVANISRKLSQFMRYTVSTESAMAQLGDELQFTENYLNLMKARYLHRLQFEIDVPEAMLGISLPKLTIQPIVENCIQHGLRDEIPQLNIKLKGFITNQRSDLVISDNGVGMNVEIQEDVMRRISAYVENIEYHNLAQYPSLQLGGMGLVSSIARLKMKWKQQFSFAISRNEDGGISVTLQGSMLQQEELK